MSVNKTSIRPFWGVLTLLASILPFSGFAQLCGPYPEWQTSEYTLPYAIGDSYEVWQGNCYGGHITNFGGPFIHSYDFLMPVGTEILAIKGGTVVRLENNRPEQPVGTSVENGGNFIRILHDDATYSEYYHLGYRGVLVNLGDRIERGQLIAKSGHTGFTGGIPHLHLDIASCPGGLAACEDFYGNQIDIPENTIAFNFLNTRSNPEGLQTGQSYVAEPYFQNSEVVISGSGHSPEPWQKREHSSGTHYDQVLLTGPTATLVAEPNRVTRLAFLDRNSDIVYVEFSGDGSLSIELDLVYPYLRNFPTKYNKSLRYSRGHAELTIEEATEKTYLSVYALGPWNGQDGSMFPNGEVYDGRADIKSINISGTGMGGLFLGNTRFSGTKGLVGIDATGVPVRDRVAIGEIEATDRGEAVLLLGEGSALAWDAGKVLVASSNLAQTNGKPISISGFDSMLSIAIKDSNGALLPPTVIKAEFVDQQDRSSLVNLSLDPDLSDASLSAPFVSELLRHKLDAPPLLAAIDTLEYGSPAIALSAKSPYSRLPVIFSVTSGHARIIDNKLATTGTGRVVVRASFPGTVIRNGSFDEQTIEVLELANPNGDDDYDGVSNFIESAFGMSIDIPDTERLPKFSLGDNALKLSFVRNRTDLDYIVERSVDMIDWLTEGVAVETIDPGSLIESSALLSNDGPVFLRLVLEK